MSTEPFKPGYIYHVYNRGNNKENIFKEEKNYQYFLSLMEKHLLQVCDVYAYCLMKNHFHLVVRIKDFAELSEKLKAKPHLAFSNFFNAYAKSINKMYNRTGSLFQEHLPRKLVETEDYLRTLVTYVHLNPQWHGFTDDFRRYKHISYHDYVQNHKSFVSQDYILKLFGDLQNFNYCHDFKSHNPNGVDDDDIFET